MTDSTCCYDAAEHKFTGKERDSETGLDYFGARYYGSNMGRFVSPDPLGGHLEDPQTLNRYTYVRNNPLNLTDPTGLDFYLTCEKESSTCQKQTVGYDKEHNAQTALVQGVTDKDGNFTATQIGNDANGNLVDRTTGTGAYTATIDGSGVHFSQGETSSTGVFVNGTASTTIAGTGAMSGFTFTFYNSKLEANQTAAGTFTFAGTTQQAGDALKGAGFEYRRFGLNFRADEYRSAGEPKTGANSAHFVVERLKREPKAGVPQSGGSMHFGEHNPSKAPFEHLKEWSK